MPDLLAPSERLCAPPGHHQQLRDQLAALRTPPVPIGTHPALTCARLSDLLASPTASSGLDLLRDGLNAAQRRYRSSAWPACSRQNESGSAPPRPDLARSAASTTPARATGTGR